MKHSLGYNWFYRHWFALKEWFKLQIPKCKRFLASMKNLIDNFIEMYKSYAYVILLWVWCISVLVSPENVLFSSCMILIVALLTLLNRHFSFKEEKFYLTTDFSKSIQELDALIAECIQEYLVMNGMGSKTFFTSKEEDMLRDETTNMVSAKMSKPLYAKLCASYNKEIIYNVIGSRIYMIIMRFVTETNTKSSDKNKAVPNGPNPQQNIIDQINNGINIDNL